MIHLGKRLLVLLSILLVEMLVPGASVRAQNLIPVPMTSVYAGAASATYNGATAAAAVCTSAQGMLNSLGDGCPFATAHLQNPSGLAIDSLNNIYVAAEYDGEFRVLYQGGAALAAALVGSNPAVTFTPTAGHVYGFGRNSALLTAQSGGAYYCNNSSTAYGTALDAYGNGCPARYGVFSPRAIGVDAQGNIFVTSNAPASGSTTVRVIYVQGTAAANLIKAYQPTVTPKPGYIYALSSPGDFSSTMGDVVVDSSENVYVSDTSATTTTGLTGLGATTNGNQIKRLSLTAVGGTSPGWVTYISNGGLTAAGTYNGTTLQGTPNGDGAAVSATTTQIWQPSTLLMDANNNLYILENESRVRVVYAGGTTAPLYVNGTGTIVANPTPGYIYTVLGGIKYTNNGSDNADDLIVAAIDGVAPTNSTAQASKVPFYQPSTIGLDSAGNLIAQGKLYFTAPDTGNVLIKVANGTGTVTVIGGWAALASTGSNGTTTTAAVGTTCNGSTGGPTMIDAYGDGCPSTEVTPLNPASSRIVADTAGNLYQTDGRVSTSPYSAGSIVRKYSFGEQMGSVAIGNSITVPLAFTFGNPGTKTYGTLASGSQSVSTATMPAISLNSFGSSTTEFVDAGTNDNCSLSTYTNNVATTDGIVVETCIYYVTFTPTQIGLREGSATISAGGVVIGTVNISGIGTGVQMTVDPAPVSTLGSGLAPSGVGIDLIGNSYVADAATNSIYLSTGGGTPALFASGFSKPSQIAVSGDGSVYVADPGNNRIALVSQSVVSTYLSIANGKALSTPKGVAVDGAGDVFLSDTGNNRVLESVAGTGAQLTLNFSGLASPQGLVVSSSGTVFVADSGNSRIVEMAPGGLQSIVSITPALATPVGVAIDTAGDLIIADSALQSVLLLPEGSSTPVTLASNIAGLTGVAVDDGGAIYYSAASVTGLRLLNRSHSSFTYPSTVLGQSVVQVLTLTDSGNVALTTGASLASSSDTLNFTISSATTNGCSINATLIPGQSCGLSTTFQPQTLGALQDNVTFPTYNLTNHITETLSGLGIKGNAPGTSVLQSQIVSPTGTISYGEPVVLSTTITTSGATATPTGTVSFVLDGVLYSTLSYAATLSTTLSLPAGVHSLRVTYSGDSNYQFSATSLSFTILRATPYLALQVAPTVGTSGNTLVLTASVGSPSVAPTGTVTISYGSTVLTTKTISNGTVSYTTGTNVLSSYMFTVTYSGDVNFLPATVTQTPTPTFVLTSAVTPQPTVSIAQGATGSFYINLNSFFGDAAAITISCSGMPANSVCRGPTGQQSLGADVVTPELVQFFTNVSPAALTAQDVRPEQPVGSGWMVSVAGLACFIGCPLWRRGRLKLLPLLIVSILPLFFGCSSDTKQTTAYVTPTGTYSVVISVSDGQNTQILPVTFIVLPANPGAQL